MPLPASRMAGHRAIVAISYKLSFTRRIEDTDLARSTAASEAAVVEDLRWLGLRWDEGPDCGGPAGPYRQSERGPIYAKYVEQLVKAGAAYPCFCSDEELDAQRREAEAAGKPPVYNGKWANAAPEEVQREMARGTPHCYRFRVPPGQTITIQVRWRARV